MTKAPRPRWTTPAEIRAQLQRRWQQGELLVDRVAGPTQLFPWQHKLRVPDSRALRDEFELVRAWIRELELGSRDAIGHGYDLVWAEVNHRQLGRNRMPEAAVIAERDQALALLRVAEQAQRFEQLVHETTRDFPELALWLAQRPFVALERQADWSRVLCVLRWLRAHPRPGVYTRQLEIPGVDSKFIESNKALLAQLLDCVLPAEAIQDEAHPVRQFEQRYGLKSKPPLVRFRCLDPDLRLGCLDDIATPAAQFAQLQLGVDNVFITENETNGLAFPQCARSIVIFGLGYGLLRLSEVPWLRDARIFYWGDIDTHGFAILDRLRGHLPEVRSFLMDRQTLELHRALWSSEASPHIGELTRLTQDEARVYDELTSQRLGVGVRLEQERIAFAWLRQAIAAIIATPNAS